MGNNPEQAATDRYGEVFGETGLFMADNSVLPTISAGIPTLTRLLWLFARRSISAGDFVKGGLIFW